MKNPTSILFLFVLSFFGNLGELQAIYPTSSTIKKSCDVIIIHHPEILKSAKEAILILPGFGDSKKRRKKQKAFFGNLEYDLFIPDYHHRKSMTKTQEKFEDFYQKQDLKSYKRIHVFTYILGAWVLNDFIAENGRGNIETIVYDHSPLQERAPRVMVNRMRLLSRISKGKILIKFSEFPYPTLHQDSIQIGIIVESRATKLIKLFRKKALSYGPVLWDADSFKQAHHDLFYTHLNHDEMYSQFDITGEDILHFFKYGYFTKTAKRTPFTTNPFKK